MHWHSKAEKIEMDETWTGWLLAGISSIIAALSTAVTWLYKAQIQQLKDLIEESKEFIKELKAKIVVMENHNDECEKAHNDLRVEYGRLSQRVDDLESNKVSRQTLDKRLDDLT